MWSSNHPGVSGSASTPKPLCSPGCQMPMAAPPGSVTTAMRPRAMTSMAGTTTPPPAASAAATVASASSTARYTDHWSGVPPEPSLVMAPATRMPSFEKLT